MRRIGGNVLVVEKDLTADGAAEAVMEAAIDEFGGLDILISNAGYAPQGAMIDIE